MSWFEALILGIVQGLTEYLPVSSSGHLAIGSALFGIEGEENLAFTIVVHVATVFSTLVVLWKEIDWIFRGLFKFQMNASPKIGGITIKKENWASFALLFPNNKPVAIVDPERDKPGITAQA